MAKLEQQVSDEHAQPQRHLQRPQQQASESPRSGTGRPTPRWRSWSPTEAAPASRARRTRTSCRTSCRSCGMEVGELLALGEQLLALVRYQPPVEIGGGVVAVQRGPFLLDALDGAEQFGAAEPGKLALRQREAGPARRGTRRRPPARRGGVTDHRHQRIRLPCTAADDLLGAGAVEELLARRRVAPGGWRC